MLKVSIANFGTRSYKISFALRFLGIFNPLKKVEVM